MILSPTRLGKRDVCAIVTTREAGCDGVSAQPLRERLMTSQMEKSCGPGLPTLRLTRNVTNDAGDGGKKPGPQGEHEGHR
jgi:hypothetical protein